MIYGTSRIGSIGATLAIVLTWGALASLAGCGQGSGGKSPEGGTPADPPPSPGTDPKTLQLLACVNSAAPVSEECQQALASYPELKITSIDAGNGEVKLTFEAPQRVAQIYQPGHSGQASFQQLVNRLQATGVQTDVDTNGSSLYSLSLVGPPGVETSEYDAEGDTAAFFDQFSQVVSEIATQIDKGLVIREDFTTDYPTTNQRKAPFLKITDQNGQSVSGDVRLLLRGRMVYCMAPILDGVTMPRTLREYSEADGCIAREGRDAEIRAAMKDFAKVKLSLVSISIDSLPAGSQGTTHFPIRSLMSVLCYVGNAYATVLPFYKEAQWVPQSFFGDDLGTDFQVECGKYVFKHVLSRVVPSLKKAAQQPYTGNHAFVRDLLNLVSKKTVIPNPTTASKQTTDQLLTEYVVSQAQAEFLLWDGAVDVTRVAVESSLQKRSSSRTSLPLIVSDLLTPAVPQTPFQKAIAQSPNRDQIVEQLEQEFARACPESQTLNSNCFLDGARRLQPFLVRVNAASDVATPYVMIGAFR
jgi:hypothetical protein